MKPPEESPFMWEAFHKRSFGLSMVGVQGTRAGDTEIFRFLLGLVLAPHRPCQPSCCPSYGFSTGTLRSQIV